MGDVNQLVNSKKCSFFWYMFYVQHLKKCGTLQWNRSVNKQESSNTSSAE
jgi:hypothetical protein